LSAAQFGKLQVTRTTASGPKYGLDPEAVVRVTWSLPNWAALNSEVYMHTVIPNLVRLGLITERTEPRYRKLGIMSDSRTAPRSDLPLSA